MWVYSVALWLLGAVMGDFYKRADGSTRDGSRAQDWESESTPDGPESDDHTFAAFKKQGLKPADLYGEAAQKYAEWLKSH